MKSKIESFRGLGRKESKGALADFAMENWGIDLNKQRSFDNMVLDLESELMTRDIDVDLTSDSLPEVETETKVEHSVVATPEPLVDAVVSVEEVKTAGTIVADNVTEPRQVEFSEKFVPAFMLQGPGAGYTVLSWWIYDWIKHTTDWKYNISKCRIYNARPILETLAYYIERDGSVTIRETRNSQFIVLS